MHRHLRATVLDNKRASLHAWQDRLRDPSLTVLLVLQVFLLFVALPLAATGVPIAQLVAWLLLLAVTLVVILSQRGVAIVTILLGLVAAAASLLSTGSGRLSPRACSTMVASYSRSQP
jgi:fucose 4-O-acetylase-like acetyltransferase